MGVLNRFIKGKNKTYSYEPRYYDNKGEGSPYKIGQKFDKYRSTLSTSRGLKSKFNKALDDAKRKGDRNLKIRMAVIFGILVFIALYIIDFDLSIFFKK